MTAKKVVKIDSGILQYIPKGAFYEGTDEQFSRVRQMWNDLFTHDRLLFCLTSLLNGSGFSKGAMSHILLRNPITGKEVLPPGLAFGYESDVIMYNLKKERVPRALKNLLMLTGTEGFRPINNARTRKIILEYIFNRSTDELDSLTINFKSKLKTLVRHALGKQNVFKILNGDTKLFMKWIGRYNKDVLPVFFHLFDRQPTTSGQSTYYKKIEQYWKLRTAAQNQDVAMFRLLMKGMPQRTVIGFRNTYKVPIELSEIYEQAKTSTKEKIQLESAAKRSGAKVKVNYKNQELYDLWKVFYYKLINNDTENIDKIKQAITDQYSKTDRIDIGECVVIIDASKSMVGSDQRPLHPFLTSLCLVTSLDNVKDVFYVGGKLIKVGAEDDHNVLIPANGTALWRGLIKAVKTGVENIVIISDGYENEVKGMFEHTYNYFKNNAHKINILHLNPVFSADAKTGTVRRLAADIDPMPLTNYKYLETELIFKRMINHSASVKKLLIQKYQKLLGGHQ